MLIDVERMRLLKSESPEMKFKLLKPNIERFFRDYIYYFNLYDRDELIIDSGYLPYHYLDEEVLGRVIELLENELGYSIIIVKTTNIDQLGYQKGDLINIRLFDPKNADPQVLDDYFNLRMYQPLYSSSHHYNNIHGSLGANMSYISCLEVSNNLLLEDEVGNPNVEENK